MLIEAALLPRNLLNEINQIHRFTAFVIVFYYGSGSAKLRLRFRNTRLTQDFGSCKIRI
jgi:hypothetical protein